MGQSCVLLIDIAAPADVAALALALHDDGCSPQAIDGALAWVAEALRIVTEYCIPIDAPSRAATIH